VVGLTDAAYAAAVQPPQLAEVTERVRAVADRIQPLLEPHPGLARRNAHAHVWLGIKVVFGEDWRARADPVSVGAFLAWMDHHPNADYGDYPGPREQLSAEARGELW
jgi:hypothetical protein